MERCLDGPVLRRAMQTYVQALRQHRDELNSLNVYPVPDGDTGTNLLLTQESVVSAIAGSGDGAGLEELGSIIARASLLAARGNSGVILSQILRGLCEAPPASGSMGPGEFARALGRATEQAYRAVARPAEGTVLSVMRDASRAATEAAQDGRSCAEVAGSALEEARAALARTKDELAELREAGVVDAGGKGIVPSRGHHGGGSLRTGGRDGPRRRTR